MKTNLSSQIKLERIPRRYYAPEGDIERALDSVYDGLATHKAQGMVDDFYYELEKMRKQATKKIIKEVKFK